MLCAQVGSTTDIVTGKVTGPPPASQPVAGATVIVTSIDTHISRSRTTNNDGRYTVVFPDGGGQYRIEVRYVGYAPAQVILSRQADEDRLVAGQEHRFFDGSHRATAIFWRDESGIEKDYVLTLTSVEEFKKAARLNAQWKELRPSREDPNLPKVK